MMISPAEGAAYIALAIVCGAAVVDVVRYEIPDGASIAILVLAAIFGMLEPGFVWWTHIAACSLMFGFGLFAFSRGWLGGGDVKLMTAIAAWAGFGGLPLMFVATSIAGGVLALTMFVLRRTSAAGRVGANRHSEGGMPLPYAVAIAVGTLWWLWASSGGPLASHYAVGDQRPVARAIAT